MASFSISILFDITNNFGNDLALAFLVMISALLVIQSQQMVTSLLGLLSTFVLVGITLSGIIAGTSYRESVDAMGMVYVVVSASGMGVLFLWVIMTLNLQKSQNPLISDTPLYYYLSFFFYLTLFYVLGILFKTFGDFDFFYLCNLPFFENYTYLEILGTNLIEFGAYLYVEKIEIVYLAGILLLFALVVAVFLTMTSKKNSFFYWNAFSLLGGGTVDTLDLGSSAYAWGFKSLPSNFFITVESRFFFSLNSIIILLGMLLTVAFYTLGERKIMGAIQRRKGPNVVGFYGILQPLADGLKLILKENIIPLKSNKFLFILAPIFSFVLAFSLWSFVPFSKVSATVDSSIGLLVVFAISSLAIYGVILGGWASNSKYAFLGAMRTTAQMVSYEIILGLIYLILGLLVGSLNFFDIIVAQQWVWFVVPLWPICILFFIAILAETNRAPFDLPEAEAEIVAGYNVEYSGILFALYFLAEYSNMLIFSAFFTHFFLGASILTNVGIFSIILHETTYICNLVYVFQIVFFILKLLIFSTLLVIVRASLPRLRYDKLMKKSWTILIPIAFVLLFGLCLKIILATIL